MTDQEKIKKYKENWYALAIAVIRRVSVSQALSHMDISNRTREVDG
jgi:hypothetical protein